VATGWCSCPRPSNSGAEGVSLFAALARSAIEPSAARYKHCLLVAFIAFPLVAAGNTSRPLEYNRIGLTTAREGFPQTWRRSVSPVLMTCQPSATGIRLGHSRWNVNRTICVVSGSKRNVMNIHPHFLQSRPAVVAGLALAATFLSCRADTVIDTF